MGGREQLEAFGKTSSILAHKPIMLGYSGQVYRWGIRRGAGQNAGPRIFPEPRSGPGSGCFNGGVVSYRFNPVCRCIWPRARIDNPNPRKRLGRRGGPNTWEWAG